MADHNLKLLDAISAKFPEHKFEIRPVPVSLQDFLPFKKDITLCYNVKKVSNRTVQMNSLHSLSLPPDESLAGNPLSSAQFKTLDESILNLTLNDPVTKEETKDYYLSNCAPLSSHQSLSVKGFCNMHIKSFLPVVILCDGISKVLQQGKYVDVQRILQFCADFDDGWKTYGWSDYTVVDSTCLLTLTQLAQMHAKKVNSSKKCQNRINLKCLSELKSLCDVSNKLITCCKVSIQYDWQKFSSKPPIENSTKFSLIADICLDRNPVESLCIIWNELMLLQNYINLLESNRGSISDSTKLPSSAALLKMLGVEPVELNENTISSTLAKFFCNPWISSQKSTNMTNNKISLAMYLWLFTRNEKPTTDVTHALWIMLIGCEKYENLVLCFKEIFKHVKRISASRLMEKTNITRLANLTQMDNQFLPGIDRLINPFECIVEMGIEKLVQDITAIYQSVRIPIKPPPHLLKFNELPSDEDWINMSKNWLTWLTRLYTSLSISYCFESALSSHSLKSFQPLMFRVVNQVCSDSPNSCFDIQSLESLMKNSFYSFSFDIFIDLVCDSSLPDTELYDEWSIQLNTANDNKKVTSIFYRSLNFPLPYITDSFSTQGVDLNDTVSLNRSQGNNIGSNTTIDENNSGIRLLKNDIRRSIHCIQTYSISQNTSFMNKTQH